MASFDELTKQWTNDFIAWGNPALVGKARATEGWAFTELSHVLYVAGAYTLFAIFGWILKMSSGPEKKEEKNDKETVAESFAKEPIKVLAVLYNLGQQVLCSYMMYGAITEALKAKYTFVCNPFDHAATGTATILHIFYLSKIYDFFDTFFIIFRGKWNQLTFLHCYHHLSIFVVYWGNAVAGYDGDIYYTVALNSFVHLVMYTYYNLNLFKIPTPWKKLVTLLQQGQFITMNLQAGYILYFRCPYPRNITWFYLIYIISLFVLFQNFANKTYRSGDKGGKKGGDQPAGGKAPRSSPRSKKDM